MHTNIKARTRWLIVMLVLLLTLAGIGGASAQQFKPTNAFWQLQVNAQLQDINRYDYHHLTVKFADNSGMRIGTTSEALSLAGVDVSGFNALLAQYPVNRVGRTFTASTPEQLDQQRAQSINRLPGQRVPDLNSYLSVRLDPTVDAVTAATLLVQLNALPQVELAYAEPIPQPATIDYTPVSALRMATDIAPMTPDFTASQGYLYTPNGSNGVNAEAAWAYNGGRGANVRVIDVEGGWTLTHEDLNTDASDLIWGEHSTDSGWYHHGTAVIGVIAGAENGYGITGIAPEAEIKTASIFQEFTFSTADALLAAYNNTQPGDVILIELHAQGPSSGDVCTCNCGQFELIAMEYWQANFDIIQTATQNGRHVVAASGNGSMNLDSAIYGGAFDYNMRDSGSILVGAGTSNGRSPHCWTNYGSRVDLQGWGDSVVTLGYGSLFNGGDDLNQYYTSSFSGTSSASPIVTASVAVVQSVAEANNFSVSPTVMRNLLRDTGTAQAADAKNIGPLPNITAALDSMLANLPPTANADTYEAAIGLTLNVAAAGVLMNDTDPDVTDVLTAILDTGPTQGQLNLNADGSFTYTSDFTATGSDSFTYFANDGEANSNMATVTITLNPPEGTPPRVYPFNEADLTTQYDWPNFTFLPLDDAEWYQIWIGEADYSSPAAVFDWFEAAQICENGVCTIPLDLWLTNGNYVWWMTYWGPNAQDFNGTWDDTTFSVNFPAASGTFALTNPMAGATVTNGPASIEWTRDPAVLWYQVWVGTDDYANTIFFDWVDATENCDAMTCSLDVSGENFIDGDYEVWVEMWGPGNYVMWPASANATFTLDTGMGDILAPVDQPARDPEPATEPLLEPATTGTRGG